MSYDISLVFDVGSKRYRPVEVGNYTSNIRDMLNVAFDGDYWVDFVYEKVAKDALPAIEHAIFRMEETPSRFEGMNPQNGWGSYKGVLMFMKQFRQCCIENPDLIIEVDK
jgi:hypothetical protein